MSSCFTDFGFFAFRFALGEFAGDTTTRAPLGGRAGVVVDASPGAESRAGVVAAGLPQGARAAGRAEALRGALRAGDCGMLAREGLLVGAGARGEK